MEDIYLLSLVVFVPTLGGLLLLAVPQGNDEAYKWISLVATVVTLGLTVLVLAEYLGLPANQQTLAARVKAASDAPQDLLVRVRWIPSFNIEYYLGVDGISLALVLLTSLLSVLAMIASWNIEKHVRAYCILFLLLETGMLGVFVALDFFLFYVFWEVMLLPMYFLIGVWGGPRREYAAIKFFLYTLLGSVLILIAMLAFYFTSEPHTFDILRLHEIGMSPLGTFSQPLQMWTFILLFIGFAIKVPVFPFHTWLPDAHVEAPTPISMLLAGVLLKMGGYGIIRIAYPICPQAAVDQTVALVLALVGVWNIVYGALAAMAQTDFKRLVAYSSISHMGYVVLGIAIASTNTDYWVMGMDGAMYQMIAHGITSAGMFFLVGVIYDRVHHRDLNRFGGLYNAMPLYGGLSFAIFFAAMGLPGLCGFVGEVFVVLGSWNYSPTMAILAAGTVILTAGYILWTLQRVFLGENEQYRALPEINSREIAAVVPLLSLAVVLGVYPRILLDWMGPSVENLVAELAKQVGRAGQGLAGM